MTARTNKRQNDRSARGKRGATRTTAPESPAAEAATVAWAVSVVGLTICDGGAALSMVLELPRSDSMPIRALGVVLPAAAVAIAIVVLGLAPVVRRLRIVPPPAGFTAWALVASVTPLIWVVVQSLANWR